MKKISFLLVILGLLFSFRLPVFGKKISTIDLENLSVHIMGSSTSVIELSFETDEPWLTSFPGRKMPPAGGILLRSIMITSSQPFSQAQLPFQPS